MTRPKSVALAFLTGAVLVGGLLGFTADRIVGEHLCERRGDQHRTFDQLATDLGLDSAQRVQFDSLLTARNQRVRVLYHDTRDQIRQMLSPDQRVRFEELVRRANERSENR
ncbi:MAG TPA: hypothetical protein VF048_01340 [Gemmatimonadaceae bacterium]